MKLPWTFDRKADLHEEIWSHMEMAAQDLRAEGKPADEAALLARREFRDIPRIADVTSSTWRWRWLEHIAQDVKLSCRRLLRSPGYAAVGIFTVALGIGPVALRFALVDSVLLACVTASPRSLGYAYPN